MTSEHNNTLDNFIRQLMSRRIKEISIPGYKSKNLDETLTNENIKAMSFTANLYADSQIIDEFNDPKKRKIKIDTLVNSYKSLNKDQLKNELAELQAYNDVVLDLLKKAELRINFFLAENKFKATKKREISKKKNIRENKFVHHTKVTKIIDTHYDELVTAEKVNQNGYLDFKKIILERCTQQSIAHPPSDGKISKAWKDKTGFTSTKKVTEHKLSK